MWDPHTESDIDRLQTVQRRAARFVMGDWRRRSSVTAMLQHLQWPSLQRRRSEAKLAMLYKIQHQLIDIPVAPNLQPLPAGLRTRGHSQRFFVPQPRVDAYKYSFFVSVTPLWNGLSPETVAALSLITFISRLHGSDLLKGQSVFSRTHSTITVLIYIFVYLSLLFTLRFVNVTTTMHQRYDNTQVEESTAPG